MTRRSIISSLFLLVGLATMTAQDFDPNLFPGYRKKMKKGRKAEISVEQPCREAADSIRQVSDSTASGDSILPVQGARTINFNILLPIGIEGHKVRATNLDFYSGALMAVKTLAEEGINVKLNVSDYADNGLIDIESDYIIGPIRSRHIETALAALDSTQLLVSPLDPGAEKLLGANSNLVQAPSSILAQWKESISWALENDPYKLDNYILIHGHEDSVEVAFCDSLLLAAGASCSKCICNVQGEIEGWTGAFSEFRRNKVILLSNNEAILNNAVRNLGIAKGELEVYGGTQLYSYDSIPIETLHQIQARIVCPSYIDYEDESTQNFVHAYRALYHSSPTQYAFHGYDICLFMGRSYAEYGKQWRRRISSRQTMKLLQSNFRLEEHGGLVNYGMRRLKYGKDYSISLE